MPANKWGKNDRISPFCTPNAIVDQGNGHIMAKRKTTKHYVPPCESTQYHPWNILATEQIDCDCDKVSRANYKFPEREGTRRTCHVILQGWNEQNSRYGKLSKTNQWIHCMKRKKEQEEGGHLSIHTKLKNLLTKWNGCTWSGSWFKQLYETAAEIQTLTKYLIIWRNN